MSANKLILSAFALLLSSTCFSQQSYKSVLTKKCQWNPQTNSYANCKQQKVSNTINIDTKGEMIFIKGNNMEWGFKITNVEKQQSDAVIYSVIAASGVKQKIELVPAKNQLILTENPPLESTTYYLK